MGERASAGGRLPSSGSAPLVVHPPSLGVPWRWAGLSPVLGPAAGMQGRRRCPAQAAPASDAGRPPACSSCPAFACSLPHLLLPAEQPDVRVVSASYGGGGYSQVRAACLPAASPAPAPSLSLRRAALRSLAAYSRPSHQPYCPAAAPRQAEYDAIAALGAANILMVAAAGNDGRDVSATSFYPAGYGLPNLIAGGWPRRQAGPGTALGHRKGSCAARSGRLGNGGGPAAGAPRRARALPRPARRRSGGQPPRRRAGRLLQLVGHQGGQLPVGCVGVRPAAHAS